MERTDIEARIRRYHPSYRRRVRQLAGLSPKLADVLASFPAAAIAIVSSELDADNRGRATRLVKNGYPLREVSAALGLPYWTRRIPPEALASPLTGVPGTPECESRMPVLVPKDVAVIGRWLQWVQFGHRAAHSEFALWLAEQKVYHCGRHFGAPLLPLAAYAWYSGIEGGVAREMIDQPWNRRMPYKAAAAATRSWLERIAACVRHQPKRRGPGRYSACGKNALRVVPLRSAAEICEEGRIMDHCVATYAGLVARGVCMILSIRTGTRRVATLEIRPRRGIEGGYVIVQLQGQGNSRVSNEVWQIVRDWLASQPRDPKAMIGVGDDFVVRTERWKEIWHPYVVAKGAAGLSPDVASLNRLRRDADALELMLDPAMYW